MTVCFFGNYMRDYPRTQVLLKGLAQNGVSVVECHTTKRVFLKYWDLYQKHKLVKGKYDVLLVGLACYSMVWFAKFLTRKKIIFDAFVSFYLTEVYDRKKVKPRSFGAFYLRLLEKLSFWLADEVLLDTQSQIDYIISEYKLSPKKFHRIFVGADDSVFYPSTQSSDWVARSNDRAKFIVHWHGHIVPFHGLDAIIDSAWQLRNQPDIEFRIITRFNQKYELVKKKTEELGLSNIEFHPEASYSELADLIREADVYLGIFGENLKAKLVIPNKVFEGIACGKPVITLRTPAIEELFESEKNIIMIGEANDLSGGILRLKNDTALRQRLSQNGYSLFKSQLTPKQIGAQLKDVLF